MKNSVAQQRKHRGAMAAVAVAWRHAHTHTHTHLAKGMPADAVFDESASSSPFSLRTHAERQTEHGEGVWHGIQGGRAEGRANCMDHVTSSDIYKASTAHLLYGAAPMPDRTPGSGQVHEEPLGRMMHACTSWYKHAAAKVHGCICVCVCVRTGDPGSFFRTCS